MQTSTTIPENQPELAGFADGDPCPVHGTAFRKLYTFGSSMTAETDVCTFHGCRCAVAIPHDPVGTLHLSAVYCRTYDAAAGIGRMRAMDWSARMSRGGF